MARRRIRDQMLSWLTRGRTGTGLRKLATHILNASGRPYPIYLDYPVNTRPRYGWGRPPHAKLHAIINRNRDRYRRNLEALLAFKEDFLRIPNERPANDVVTPCWNNASLPALDAAALYALLCRNNPRRYFEVGIGNSTQFARRAIRDHGLRTEITGIDPYANPALGSTCDRHIRKPLEDVDLSLFDELEAGDILFIDNSHRVFMNSDATVVFLDIVPNLHRGVLVEIHDIALPVDYPWHWVEHYYSEQYLLAAYLLAEGAKFDIVMPNAFISLDDKLKQVLQPLWTEPKFHGIETHGASFWFSIN